MSHRNRMSRKNHSIRLSHWNRWIPTSRRWNRMSPMNHTSRPMSRSYRMTRTNDDGDDDARLPRCWPPLPTRPPEPVRRTTSTEPFDSPPELKHYEPQIARKRKNTRGLDKRLDPDTGPHDSLHQTTRRSQKERTGAAAQIHPKYPRAAHVDKIRKRKSQRNFAHYTWTRSNCNRESQRRIRISEYLRQMTSAMSSPL